MSELQITAKLKIHDGQLDNFKELARKCMESVKTKDSGTKQYDWFMSPDGTECLVREGYVSSSALLEHITNLGDTLGELLAVSDFSAEVCGSPSEELMNALKGMDIKTYSFLQGM